MKGIAFSPAHITGFFKAELDQTARPEMQGSLGAGFSIQEGVTTTVEVQDSEFSDHSITISGYQPDNTQVSEFVISEFLKNMQGNYFLKIHHDIKIPVGYGLGCSAAVALSLAYALNSAFRTNYTKEQLGTMAHNAEVMCRTGLGDVLASYHGGFEIRVKGGAPGIGQIKKIPSESHSAIMICFSPISTKQFLKDRLASINGLGGKMVDKLVQTKNIDQFHDYSIEFANYVDIITPKMKSVIDDLKQNGIRCGVALFGETIFTLVKPEMEEKVISILEKYPDGIIIRSKIDQVGARLVH
ncbi:pantoate kinase [Candidatus Nitrosotenuis aquarius]|uniref:pantoate kinase n=1 Tax=Candidatus Nitrosotenuis aquarius TaxID=1846278 RepID=UPI000C1F11AD|nr:GHMP kinase [Candidatus Nitrosotenuis aquarius]